MITYKKKEVLKMISTLIQANDTSIKIMKEEPEAVIEMLIQCQEAAFLLGSFIETLDEQYIHLVKVLEDYCENIYQMSEVLSNEDICKSLYKKIKIQLLELNHEIQTSMPDDKKEVVFLPYKASMWDSLESIWKKMSQDENVEVYVIPIPYFDKNSDGSFRKEYYEGDLYPKYVPITKYEEYDFEQRKPDLIFIHNPYDECNMVTSVHPFFYAKNLRSFTEQLIYIPYFILEEINPKDKESINKIRDFCITPGVLYADKVIVQSEDMRQIYINVLTEISGDTKEIREYWEKKIDGSGSPKVDKVLNTKKEELEIPNSWLSLIQKSNGDWKRIIFYNTSVGALLDSNEKMLRKIEDVFRIFERNKEEVTLLWRPHPLMESTLTSMRPQLWEQYKKLREQYIKEGWGIYDDTPDLDRAIVLSDMYYGDSSSITTLCKKCNKKVMIQDYLHLSNNDIVNNFLISDMIEVNNKLYFLHPRCNALFEVDNKKHLINKIYKNRIKNSQLGAYNRIVYNDDKIYMLPKLSDSIEVLDLDTNTIELVEIPIREIDYGVTKFKKAIADKGYIYIIPEKYPGIIKFNILNNEIMVYDNWILDKNEGILDGLIVDESIVLLTEFRIIFINKYDGTVERNIILDNIKILKIIEVNKEILGICEQGNLFEVEKEQEKIVLRSKLILEMDLKEIEIFSRENSIWIVDTLSGTIFQLDLIGKIENQINIYNDNMEDIYFTDETVARKIGNKIYISSFRKYKVFILEMDTKILSEWKVTMSKECWQYLWEECNQFDKENEFPQFCIEKRILWK